MKQDGALLLTTGIWLAEGAKAVALLAVQPDRERPGECVLDVTIVSERVPDAPLRLSVQWPQGRRTARVRRDATARLRGVPAVAIEALRAGDPEALLLQIEQVEKEP